MTGTRHNPYIGPRSFQTGEMLYGRDREVRDLIGLLLAERIVLLHSPSGAGKTSLVQAALLPTLRDKGFRILPIVRVNTEPPDLSPQAPPPRNRYILSVLMALEEDVPEAQQIPLDDLAQMTLCDYLNHRLSPEHAYGDVAVVSGEDGDEEGDESGDEDEEPDPSEVLLIFDQFEEILTIDPTSLEAKTDFFKQVGEALYQGRRQETMLQQGQRWALFSMREDYIAGLEPYMRHVPTRLKNTFRLDLLGATAARQAIQQPAHTQGVTFSPDAVTQLVDDLRKVQVQQSDGTVHELPGPYVEPVQLQVVCHRLWKSLPPDTTHIDTQAIETVGDVNTALAGYYDGCVAAVAGNMDATERAIREWFGRHLITAQGIRGQVLQGEGSSEGLSNAVIWALIDTYLVRAEKRRGATWFELAHDRLIEPVSTSNREWFHENLAMFQMQATMWAEQHRPDGMLLRGEALTEAEAWATTHPEEITSIEEAFLERCREVRRETEQKEAQRRRNMRIAWGVAAILSVLLVFALGATWFAAQQHQQAEAAKELAEEKLLVAESQRLAFAASSLPDQPETAMLLAYESVHLDHSPVTEQTLRDALDRIKWWPQVTPLNTPSEAVEAHLKEMTSATFRPDNTRFLTASEKENNVYEWDLEGNVRQTFEGHTEPVYRARYSADGERIVTVSYDTTARVWDTEGKTLAVLEGHEEKLRDATFSPDTTLVATTSDDMTARLWELDGTPRAVLEGHTDWVFAVVFSPDGEQVLTTSWDTTARLWEIDGTSVVTLEGHTHLVIGAAFSPDGQYIVTTSLDKTARLWDRAGTQLAIMRGHSDLVLDAVFNHDSTRILTNSWDGTARLWDLTGENLAILQGHTDRLVGTTFSNDDQQIITVSRDNTIRVWHDMDVLIHTLNGHSKGLERARYTPDGQRIVTISDDETVRVWDREGALLETLEGHSGAVSGLDISTDGQLLVTGAYDATARVWSIAGDEQAILEGHTDTVKVVAFTPDSDRIVTASWDGTVRIWSIEGELLVTLPDQDEQGPIAVISPDGQHIVTAANDTTAQVWSINGDLLTTLEGHDDSVWSAAFSPDGTRIATGSGDYTLKLWTVNGELLASRDEHKEGIKFVTYSPDGQYILTASDDMTARLWDSEANPVALLKGHTGGVIQAAFSPDGQHIVTSAWDNTARLWDLDGTLLATLNGHSDAVRQATFSPDGQRILTASLDGTARQSLVHLDDVLALATCSVGRGLTEEEQERFRVEEIHLELDNRQCPPRTGGQPETK